MARVTDTFREAESTLVSISRVNVPSSWLQGLTPGKDNIIERHCLGKAKVHSFKLLLNHGLQIFDMIWSHDSRVACKYLI